MTFPTNQRAAALLPLVCAALLSGCRTGGAEPALTGCTVAAGGVTLPRALHETSGAAWSRRAPGVWWSLNDSGNGAELFALDSAGRLLATVEVAGSENDDWEDLAAGPCRGGAGDCLYVADIGDNGRSRAHVTVYRIPEPAARDGRTAPAEVFRARYPGGRRNAEAFFVLPDGQAYVVTKGGWTTELFRFPLDSAGVADMALVRVLHQRVQEAELTTGAGASPDGRWIALRTYASLHLYRREDLLGSGPPALSTSLRSLEERQGEAVAVAPGGQILLTTERGGRLGSPWLTLLSCPPPAANPPLTDSAPRQ